MHLVGYLYEDYHVARLLEHKVLAGHPFIIIQLCICIGRVNVRACGAPNIRSFRINLHLKAVKTCCIYDRIVDVYRGADKSLARLTSRCILFYGENISFDASLVIYVNSTNIPPIMIINRIYEHQNLLSL
jgi:hypothetical protein